MQQTARSAVPPAALPRRIAEVVRWTRGPRILDVGCTGYRVDPSWPYFLHARLRERFPEVVGVDVRADAVARMRALGYRDLHVQSAEDFDLPTLFETIVVSEVIAHLSNAGRFLERARAHLAPGGRIVVTTPYPFALSYWLYPLLKYPRTNPDPTLAGWYCPQTLSALAERHGFAVAHADM